MTTGYKVKKPCDNCGRDVKDIRKWRNNLLCNWCHRKKITLMPLFRYYPVNDLKKPNGLKEKEREEKKKE